MSEHRLDEIVIERPRGGARLKSPPGAKKALQKNYEEGRKYESLRRSWKESGHTKHFSDHLGPLYRWLRSKVGQHWNDVYSELCDRLDTKTLSGQHILSHVWDAVERNVVLVDGVPYPKNWLDYRLGYYRDRKFYVHPDTGILCVSQKVVETPTKKRDDLLVVDAYHQYRQLNDIWYAIALSDLPKTRQVTDVVLKEIINPLKARNIYGREVYAISKRQCNKKEIQLIKQQLSKN